MRSDLAVDAAQTHTTTGQQFFSVGKFAEARIEFEAAFALTKEPDLLFNVALSWEREGSVREAIAAYERYLLARPTDADTRAKVERMLKAVALPTPQNPDGQKPKPRLSGRAVTGITAVSYTHLTLPTNREV